ncbi:hypothetical protein DYB37_008131 [Aphanomyces astaci]|uniref:PCIF1 WW domain-containing protein n=1 Tax=Aphanomyces astaci TaxID=112090 RepID=A0A3R6X4X8_APHAT|nr:hypothetical protein DYB35_007680 [Aphanomyces astaci]RHZ28988.1 hypothetical protein DYB37_008131 [Aphanomyces astaci]
MDDIDAILNSMAAKTGNVSAVKVAESIPASKSALKKRKHVLTASSPGDNSAIWNADVQIELRHIGSSEHKVRPCNLQNVSPAYELHRQKCVLKLKAKLSAAVEQMGLPKLPNSAYETWQFCSKLAVPDGDPLIPHSDSDYAGLRDELVAIGANRHAANKTCRAMTQEAHRVGQSLLRLAHGGGKKRATIRPNEDHYLVSYGGTSLRLNRTHLDKLQTLFDRHHAEAATQSFPDFLFCLLLRCFEANPPFVPALIAKMASHMTLCLQNATKALSFIVIIPAWEHTEGWQLLKNSPFNKEYLLLTQKHHGYCEGKQQMRPTRYRIASFDTSVFFWQNAMAASKWPVTDAALDDLRLAFKSKQSEERDDLGLKQGGKKVKRVKASS